MADPAVVLETFDTLYELAVKLGQVMERGLAERGLSSSRAEVLLRLHGQGPMVQRELSQALQCTPRYVTALIDQLEAARLAVRKPHPTDRRATLVTLTAKGTKLADRIFTERAASAHQTLGDIPLQELETTVAVLRRFIDQLQPAPHETPGTKTRLTT